MTMSPLCLKLAMQINLEMPSFTFSQYVHCALTMLTLGVE